LGSGSGMALTDKLRDLDQRLLPGTREQDEDAETYLRRVASGRAISPAQAGDVMAALRVYFDVAPDNGDGDDADGESSDGESSGEESSDESKDEAGEESEEKSDDNAEKPDE
jgi:hypothetical protein